MVEYWLCNDDNKSFVMMLANRRLGDSNQPPVWRYPVLKPPARMVKNGSSTAGNRQQLLADEMCTMVGPGE